MLNKFIVSPMSQKITLTPGETYEGSITVGNPADATEKFNFKISIYPYTVSGENYDQDFSTYSVRSQIVEWLKVDTTSGELAPNETKDIKVTINVPENAPVGGQYAMIGVSSNAETNLSGGGTVQNVYEMASLIYANVEGEAVHKGEILGVTMPEFVAVGNPAIKIKVSNAGNVHESLYSNLSIKNMITGEMVFSAGDDDPATENIIMPDTTRLLSQELTSLPALGVFEVTENLSYLDEDMLVSGVLIICPIWFMALVFFTIVSIISMICYGRHLKKKRKNTEESLEK